MENVRMLFIMILGVLLLIPQACAITPEQLENIEFRGIYDDPVQLSNGQYEGAPFGEGGASRPTVILLDELMAVGDVNGDSVEDAAVVLVEHSGGSGTFSYLAAVLNHKTQPVNSATLLLGDRVNIKAVTIENGQIVVDLIEQSEKVQKSYQLQKNTLVETGAEKLGALSLNDLEGQTWRMTSLILGEELAPATEISAVFADGKISGSSGCNRFSAAVTVQEAGKLSIGPAMGTRKACPKPIMQQEDAFLKALGTVTQFSFSGGQLVLTHEGGALLFSSRPSGE